MEVTPSASQSTIGLAAAARQTGGKLVCILPEPVLGESEKVIQDSGLKDMVEFKTGDPSEILLSYENIDFSLVDCKNDDYTRFLKLLDVNPNSSVVVANNLVGAQEGLGGHIKGMKEVRSMKNPIGKGMEITMIGKTDGLMGKRYRGRGSHGAERNEAHRLASKRSRSSRWVFKVDEESGEEHIFRVLKTPLTDRVPKSL